MRLLLVDDDQALLTVLSASLKKFGYDIVTAATGNEGIEKTKVQKPDMVLLDQVLPDIQGNEVLQTLKADPETKDIPVAMLSNFGQNELVQKSINMGAVEYFLKYQVEPDFLDRKIKEIIGNKTAPQGSPQGS